MNTLQNVAPYLLPWAFERTPASSEAVSDSYLTKVREATFVLWLVGSRTTDAVEAEINEALSAGVRILVFLLPATKRDDRTEELITRVSSKYRKPPDLDALAIEVDLALNDEVARALKGEPTLLQHAQLELLGRASRARCVERWQATGLDAALALELANDITIGAGPAEVLPSSANPLAVLTGEAGAGKSLAAERLLQGAIADRRGNVGAPIPVFTRARTVDSGLRQLVQDAAEGLGDPAQVGVMLVIDGADEPGSGKAGELLAEARELVRTWTNTRILLTTRPLSVFSKAEEAHELPRLTPEQSRELVGIAAHREVTLGDQASWADPVKAAAEVPLFAVLLGLRLGRDRDGAARGQLLADLAEWALRSSSPSARPLLRRLAVQSLLRGGSPVPASELGGPGPVSELEETRLVVARDGQVSFPLILVAQWFAAESLAEGVPPVEELTGAAGDLELWRYALAILAGNFTHDQVTGVIGPLAEAHPGFASQIIDESIARWSRHRDAGSLPLTAAGRRIREATGAWLRGLGPLAGDLFPSADADEVALPPLGITATGSHLVAGWYQGEEALDDVVPLPQSIASLSPDVPSLSLRRAWPHIRGSRPSEQAGWAWLWSLEELRHELKHLIQQRELPTVSRLRPPRLWLAARLVLGLPSGHEGPIKVAEARARADELWRGAPTKYTTGGIRIDIDRLRAALSKLELEGQTTLPPPEERQPGQRLVVSRQLHNELMLERVAHVYTQTMDAYAELTQGRFAQLAPFMQTASLLPACMHAWIYPIESGVPDGGAEPGIAWWLEALPEGEESRTDFNLERTREDPDGYDYWISRADEVVERTRALRPKQARWISVSFHSSYLRLRGALEVEEIVMNWLWDDLARIAWVEGNLGERSSPASLP